MDLLLPSCVASALLLEKVAGGNEGRDLPLGCGGLNADGLDLVCQARCYLAPMQAHPPPLSLPCCPPSPPPPPSPRPPLLSPPLTTALL